MGGWVRQHRWAMLWLNSQRRLGSLALVCCGVVGMLWWVSVVHEWVAGFNTVSVWMGLWVDQCVHGGGLGGFRGGGCGCCLVGRVGVGLVDFFFLSYGLWWWWWLWLWLCV